MSDAKALRERVAEIRKEALHGRYGFASVADCLDYIARLEAVAEAARGCQFRYRDHRIMCDDTCGCEACSLDNALKQAGEGE